ncbi:MAG: hypothetical protein CMQ83_02605 [Gammaproteobacteria bacterium]|nr:hypothetical protein [Gammaproteobacteria bacterium]
MEKPNNFGKHWSWRDRYALKSSYENGESVQNLSIKYKRTVNSIKNQINIVKIKDIIEKRQIKELLHFTDKRNINFIKKFGLLGINALGTKKIQYYSNDSKRLDGMPACICLSVSYLNRYLLRSYNAKEKRDWVQITINPIVLFTRGAYFFDSNAANKKFRDDKKYNYDYLRSADAFESMFADCVESSNGKYTREKNISKTSRPITSRKLANVPTDLQAEILVSSYIPLSYIMDFKEIDDV